MRLCSCGEKLTKPHQTRCLECGNKHKREYIIKWRKIHQAKSTAKKRKIHKEYGYMAKFIGEPVQERTGVMYDMIGYERPRRSMKYV